MWALSGFIVSCGKYIILYYCYNIVHVFYKRVMNDEKNIELVLDKESTHYSISRVYCWQLLLYYSLIMRGLSLWFSVANSTHSLIDEFPPACNIICYHHWKWNNALRSDCAKFDITRRHVPHNIIYARKHYIRNYKRVG